MKALISVYDKSGIEDFGDALDRSGFDLISTGGTYDVLSGAGVKVRQISDVTGSPEILDGRVKTLHPTIHGGILGRRDLEDHRLQMSEFGIDNIDVVVVNLYPFVETVLNADSTLEDGLENIDIGGPTMLRAAAKNYPDVLVVVDPSDYAWIGERLLVGGDISASERKKLALKAFQHVSFYDSAVATWLNDQTPLDAAEFTAAYSKLDDLRYGENPHQSGAVYASVLGSGGIVRAERLHGLPMSYTNVLDADGAWTSVTDFSDSACVIVKHTNPCGIALDINQARAYEKAFQGDSVSAYGGIVAFNRNLEVETAEAMRGVLFDIIIAPSYEEDALEILRKRKRTRLLRADLATGALTGISLKSVSGGALLQTVDDIEENRHSWKVVTESEPTDQQWKDLEFSWKCLKHIKSNTIVLAKDNMMVGMGAGQPNRVVSIHLSLRIAGDKSKGSALASDAFMPFADNIEMAAEGGITAIAQPGGSIRDDEVIAAANEAGIAMVFTGVRHFNH
ncbi:MAG: bifunctional phosphoribosylaminoimidazolecarboxamide formyltransferase/IMP cyclohydrolase [Chloroflexota bacterium]|nr:bifunctional phosphoribosylaminoimidazolecarboxamide formyltransferase/IMP cyclohydrolase [Chloroflexota bacterium]